MKMLGGGNSGSGGDNSGSGGTTGGDTGGGIDTSFAGIISNVKDIITDVTGVEMRDVPLDTDLSEFDIDSLDWAEVVMGIEEEYDIKVDTSAIANIRTLTDIANYIQEKLG